MIPVAWVCGSVAVGDEGDSSTGREEGGEIYIDTSRTFVKCILVIQKRLAIVRTNSPDGQAT